MTDEITPALTPEQWKAPKVYFRKPGIAQRNKWVNGRLTTEMEDYKTDEGYGVELAESGQMLVWDDSWAVHIEAENRQGVAALCLLGQPFGFTQQDVTDERMAYMDLVMLARQAQDMGDESMRLKRIEQSRRHYERAAKIAALLPPPA